jgi:hydroxypyruvate isomerase
MPGVRFSANLSFLFKDSPFAERFARARDAGFTGVEFMWPGAEEVAAKVGCTRLNAFVGVRLPELELESQLELARQNVAWAAEQAQVQGASIMIEAVNTFENGPYLLDTTANAVNFLDAVRADNVALQYDVYHMQRMEGNLSDTISRVLPRIGHVHIADPPRRTEPGTGEINYGYILDLLERSGYTGWVGLEYNPSTPTTEESLGWIKELGYA